MKDADRSSPKYRSAQIQINRHIRKLILFTATALFVQLAAVGVSAAAFNALNLQKNTAQKSTAVEAIEADDSAIVFVPNTEIALVPPPGFTLASSYTGFENLEDLSSILVVELPASAHTELFDLLTSTAEAVSTAFAERGLFVEVDSLSTINTITQQDTEIPFVSGIQTVGALTYRKYFALFRKNDTGEGDTTLLTFNLTADSTLSEADVLATVRSVQVSPSPMTGTISREEGAALTFTFEAASPFQQAYSVLGSSVLLNLSGELETDSEEPLIIIASSFSPTGLGISQPTELASFSAQLLRDTDGFSELAITESSAVNFAGSAGHFIAATSQNEEHSAVSQYVRVLPDGHYIRMLVVGMPEELKDLSLTIQAVKQSIEPNQ